MPDEDWESEFRRRRFAQLKAEYDQSPDRVDEEQVEQHRAIERPKVIAFLDAFKADGDLGELRRSLDSWSKTTGTYFGFKGPNGQMYLNQLTKDGEAMASGRSWPSGFHPLHQNSKPHGRSMNSPL